MHLIFLLFRFFIQSECQVQHHVSFQHVSVRFCLHLFVQAVAVARHFVQQVESFQFHAQTSVEEETFEPCTPDELLRIELVVGIAIACVEQQRGAELQFPGQRHACADAVIHVEHILRGKAF